MSVRISTGLRNKILLGATGGGVKGALDGGKIYLYSGSPPASPDTGATGTNLGIVTLNGDGSTGVTFDAPVSGVLAKAAAETWQFVGLTDGQVGWFRFSAAGDTPTANSSTAPRLDGTVGTAGADVTIGNTNIVNGSVNTIDNFTITQPGS